MLHRPQDGEIVLISQPAHAWISGQLAIAWGNPELGLAPTSLELQIAAEQHDIAWLDWEQRPTLNSQSGLPRAFNEMPTLEHLELWSTAMPRALAYGRIPALLISMHGTYLYRRFHDFERDTSREAARAKDFLQIEEEKQKDLLRKIRASRDISQSAIHEMRELLSIWDAMSLAICMGIDEPRSFRDVPGSNGRIEIRFSPDDRRVGQLAVDPWPFASDRLEVGCEGRRLTGTFDDEQTMRQAIADAESVTLRFSLVPG